MACIISKPNEDQLASVAQPTQRTNQFDFSIKRYLETEITEQLQGSSDCRIVQVRDRFGEYGLDDNCFDPSATSLQSVEIFNLPKVTILQVLCFIIMMFYFFWVLGVWG